MLEAIRDPTTYCTTTLPQKIDFSLWTVSNQEAACSVAFEDVLNMNKFSPECIDDKLDTDSCDPCTKVSDSLFEQYRQFMQNNMLKIMTDISEIE